ncbi:MAG TPA: hypothetical protein VFE55_17700 [Acidimicrobiia bacterium]|nr:hypothetical protein [Acidimicrobiia bacterium]
MAEVATPRPRAGAPTQYPMSPGRSPPTPRRTDPATLPEASMASVTPVPSVRATRAPAMYSSASSGV